MMRTDLKMSSLVAIAVALLSTVVQAKTSNTRTNTVEVIYTQAAVQHASARYLNVPKGWHVVYYDLDAADRLKAGLNDQLSLPGDPAVATRQVQSWLRTPSGQAYTEQLRHAYEGHAKVMNYGITRLPALVINGQYLFYGVRNIETAIHALSRYPGMSKGAAQ